MTTLADLKRALTVGTALKLIDCDRPDHKYMNTTRKIEKVQTNAIKFEGGSWLEFGKSKDYTFFDGGFRQTCESGCFLEYLFTDKGVIDHE